MLIHYNCPHVNRYTHLSSKRIKVPDDRTYRWHLVNLTPDMKKSSVVDAFNCAFATWQEAFDPLNIKLESTPLYSKANIFISFAPKIHTNYTVMTDSGLRTLSCVYPFDGFKGTLAHSFSLASRYNTGQIHFDEDENWSKMHTRDGIHLLTVAIHEIGHVFDIGHSNVREAIMYHAYTGIKTILHDDDIKALHTKYKKER